MAIKGMKKDMTCTASGNTKQYAIGEIAECDASPVRCTENGLHYVEAPHHVFSYYSPGTSRFFEVEPLGEIDRKPDDDSKCATNKLRIGAEISIPAICKIAVEGFFEWFKFRDKIRSADTNNAGDCGAANAGNCGAANAGNYGAANAGDCGAANAGNYGAANAGDCGAANAGDYGAAIVGTEGAASVGENGIAVCRDNNSRAKGGIGAVLVFTLRDDDGNTIDAKTAIVGKDGINPDTWYTVCDGNIIEATE